METASSMLWDSGTTGIAEEPNASGVLVAGFASRSDAEKALATLGELDGALHTGSISPYEWTGSSDSTQVSVPGLDQPLSIVSGPLFGHGGHQTTQLVLELLSRHGAQSGIGRVLDVGTGTGILAIAAQLLGASDVTALDYESAAIEIVASNAAANGVGPGRIDVLCGRAIELPALLGDGPTLPQFDVVVANMLLPSHRELAPVLDRFVAVGGSLLVAGTLESDDAELVGVYRSWRRVERIEDGEWVAYRFVLA